MNKKSGLPLAIIGVGMVVGSFVGTLNFVQLLLLAIGLGLIVGSILSSVANFTKKDQR
ncbi:MAG: hypothetical protein QM401_02995 [Bacillota bacterium]|nr:hypothetical protein [Bacillota bacterium]HHU62428.1 hypothetical protein [Natronincola sp.]